MSVAVVGVGRTAFSRESGRTPQAMAVEACRAAIDDAGLTMADVDGWASFQYNDSAMPGEVAWAAGRDEVEWAPTLFGGGDMAAQVVMDAVAAIESGRCRAAVAFRSLNGRSGYRFGTVTQQLAVPGKHQFDAPSGFLVPPQFIAAWARRYQDTYGSTELDLAAVAVMQRRHAQANPHAVMRTPMNVEDYLAGRWVCEPFRVNDCAYEVDGAVAVVVTSAELARDTRHTPIWYRGGAGSWSGSGWTAWDDMTAMYSRSAAPRLWQRTGFAPADIDVACMYDCFTYTVLATLEDYGFCGPGEAGKFLAEGHGTYGGDVVVNPHGGLLSEGYLHGMNHHYEAVVQLRGDAGERQVAEASVALVTAGAGPFGGAVVYSREESMTIAPEHAAMWPQPLPDPDTAGFWESTASGVLAVCRCQDCLTWMHPPLERCRRCAGPISFAPVSGGGALHTWIVVNRQSVPGPTVPYLIGVAELEEDAGIRISGVLRMAEGQQPRIGMPVIVVLEPVPGGDYVGPVIVSV